MAGARIHVVMSPDLVQRIDAARGEGQSRGDWIRRVIEQALNRADGERIALASAHAIVAEPDRFSAGVVETAREAVERALGGEQERDGGLAVDANSSESERLASTPERAEHRPIPAPAEQPLDDTPAPSAELPPERASQLAEVDEILRGVARSPAMRTDRSSLRVHLPNCKCPVCS